MLPYDLSFSWLESNVEGPAVEAKINSMFAKAFGNDLSDVAFNGDGVSSPTLDIFAGYFSTVAADSSAHAYTRADSTDWKNVFYELFRNMPDKYKGNRKNLAYFVNYEVEQAYPMSLASRPTVMGDAYMTEDRNVLFMGIEIVPVSSVATGSIILTPRENLHLGFGRDIRVGKFINERKRVIEYTISARVDADYAVSDAMSYCV